MKIKRIATALSVMCFSTAAFGQGNDVFITGQVMSQSSFNYTDILKLSQYNTGFGTARSTAMGGAFTSLGADMSSMNINPAGLGMYRSSEYSITPSLILNRYDNRNTTQGVDMAGSDNRSKRFAFNNIGAAFNMYQGSGTLTSFTFGVAYNKLADFNTHSDTYLPAESASINDIFAIQLQGVPASEIKGDGAWRNLPVNMWGAAMAYKTLLLDRADEANPDGSDYRLWTIAPDIPIANRANLISRGSVGEYSISTGFNLQNKVYFGFSLGIQDIYLDQSLYYNEWYDNNTGHPDRPAEIAPANSMDYFQHKRLSGTGVNFKFGAIVRPVDQLRLGVAIHTPTFGDVKMKYGSYMAAFFVPYNPTPDTDPVRSWDNAYDYDFNTPTRLLVGASWTFGDVGLLSFDYERTWYNGMRLKGDVSQDMKDFFKDEIKFFFKGGNTFRVGGEVRPHPLVALRAGFTHAGSIMKDDNYMLDSPVMYETYNVSAGVGVKLGRSASLDLAYVYMNSKYTTYDLFIYQARNNNGDVVDELFSGRISQTLKRHNAMLTLGFRF